MHFSVEDHLVQETTRNVLEPSRSQWVYDHNQYVILNLALGGAHPAGWRKWTGSHERPVHPASSLFPQTRRQVGLIASSQRPDGLPLRLGGVSKDMPPPARVSSCCLGEVLAVP